MNLLGYIFLMLTLMSILTIGRFRHVLNQETIHLSLVSRSRLARALTNTEELRLFMRYCDTNLKPGPKRGSQRSNNHAMFEREETKKRPAAINPCDKPLHQDIEVGDFLLTERLNLHELLCATPQEPQQALFCRLIHILYKDQPPFQDPQIIKKIFDTLASECAKTSTLPQSIQEAGGMALHDPQLQLLWYLMLKGKPGLYPSLLSYLKWDTSRVTRLQSFRLPLRLWLALTADPELTEKIINKREELLDQYIQDKKQKRECEKAFENFIHQLAPEAPWRAQLSYRILPPDLDFLVVSEAMGRPIKFGQMEPPTPSRLDQLLIR